MATDPRKKTYYEYKVTLGKDINGKPIRKSIYSTKSKHDARKKGERFRAQYELEIFCCGGSDKPKVKFETWALRCLDTYKKPYVKGNTYSGTYLIPLNQRLLPHFGQMYLEDILPLHIQNYINNLTDRYAAETIHKDFSVLSFIMQHAVDNDLCKSNPAKKSIHLPKIIPPDKDTYTQEEYDKAYAFATGHPDGLAIMLLMETGITRSELLGLRWKDIDLETQTLHVTQGLVAYQDLANDQWVMESDGLKNKYRKRSIPLINPQLLHQLRGKPRWVAVPTGTDTPPKKVYPDHVFHSPLGQPYQPQNWSHRIFNGYRQDLHAEHPELPTLTPHELRHTRATLWLAQGISPLMVAKLLEHGDLKMLTKIYDHTDVNTLRQAMVKE